MEKEYLYCTLLRLITMHFQSTDHFMTYKADFINPCFQEEKVRAKHSTSLLLDPAVELFHINQGTRKQIENLRTIRADYLEERPRGLNAMMARR